MLTQWFIDIARDFYDNIFNHTKKVGDDSLAAREVNTRKMFLIPMINSPLSKEEKYFVRVMHLRGPQLKEAIENFDVMSRYCYPDNCKEEQDKETLIKIVTMPPDTELIIKVYANAILPMIRKKTQNLIRLLLTGL